MSAHVVIVGGGFGGLYAANALGKKGIAVTLVDRRNFHLFQPLLYQPGLSTRAACSLERLGASVLTDTRVEDIDEGSVRISRAGKDDETLEARTVVWSAGTKSTPFADRLAQRTACEQDRAGRLMVQADLALPGHPEIFVIAYLIEYDNKLLVLIQWAWNYMTRKRGARLITGDEFREVR